MRKWLTVILVVGLTAGCGGAGGRGEKGNTEVEPTPTAVPCDTTDILPVAEPVAEETMPERADELFDDFIFNYAQSERLQRRRTEFPLPFYNDSIPQHIERDEWQHDYLFTQENVYTLLFDHEEDIDMVGDTSLTSVKVEWIFLEEKKVKRYYFEKKAGAWMLEAINLRRMEEQGGTDNFVDFYLHFATDSVFRLQHICNPLHIITIDPDDEFAILETSIDAEQLPAFAPQLPADKLSNIDYGQRNEDLSRTKIMKLNGIGNGYSSTFYFRRKHGEWELYKYEDTSI